MPLRSLLILFLVLALLDVKSQNQGYYFVEGWTSGTSYQIDDSLLTVSIHNVVSGQEGNGRHRILLSKSSLDSKESREVVFNFDSAYVTSYFYGSSFVDKSLIVCGSYSPSLNIDTQTGYIAKFSELGELIQKRSFGFGLVNQPSSVVHTRDGTIAIVGAYKLARENLKSFFMLLDSSFNTISEKTYLCNDFSRYNGCNLDVHQISETKDGNFIISSSVSSDFYEQIQYPLVQKIDRNGTVLWSYNAKEEVHSYANPIVIELDDGSFKLFSYRNSYLPFQNPLYPQNYLPTPDLKATTFVTTLNSSGKEVSRKDIASQLDIFYDDDWDFTSVFSKRAIKTQDGGYVICGDNYADKEVGDQVGFLMKLDTEGEISWFRRYQVDTSNPYDEKTQKTFINGVSELSSGGFVLSGRYISPPAPEFNGGPFNSALTIITDEYGCVEPGCQYKIGIDKVEVSQYEVVPNPSNGVFRIYGESLEDIVSVRLVSLSGQVVEHFENRTTDYIDIKAMPVRGIYFLSVLRSNGVRSTSKVIFSN